MLGACAAASAPPPSAPAPPRSSVIRVPEAMPPEGLEGVIGSAAGPLTGRFGTPRIDLAEGDARKLQFAGPSCVLDIYLYPMSPGSEAVASHVETRLRRGGAEIARAACIREVEQQHAAR